MSTVVLLLITGLGLGALYFLVAAGLSLIYGLMGVLNFAHGAFLTIGAFAGWEVARRPGRDGLVGRSWSRAAGRPAVGAAVAAFTEFFLIRRLYQRHIEQAAHHGRASRSPRSRSSRASGAPIRSFTRDRAGSRTTTEILGAAVPNDRFVLHRRRGPGAARACVLFLRHTRYGMIIRAGVENRSMVTALGIDVRKRLHPRVRDRRRRRGARRGARLGCTSATCRRMLGRFAADLRLHRHRDRRTRLADRRGHRRGRSSPCCSSSPTSTSAAPATSSSCWPWRRAAVPSLRPARGRPHEPPIPTPPEPTAPASRPAPAQPREPAGPRRTAAAGRSTAPARPRLTRRRIAGGAAGSPDSCSWSCCRCSTCPARGAARPDVHAGHPAAAGQCAC